MNLLTGRKNLEDYIITPAETSVIFKDNMELPIHRWFHYAEGFSNEFVNYYFNKYQIENSNSVFEPFMGSGTVGLSAKLSNINSFGVELNPLMHFISTIKTNFEIYSPITIENLRRELFFPQQPMVEAPSFLRNDKHFDPEILLEILKIKEGVLNLPDLPEKDLFKLAFANILIKSSNAKRVPSFGYKAKKNLNKDLPYKLFNDSLNIIVEDLLRYSGEKFPAVNIVKGDSRIKHFKDNCVDIALTSPPYANGIDYVTDYQLEMGWLDLIDQEEKALLRDGMIAYDKTRSSLLKEFYNNDDFYKEEHLMKIIKSLEEISSDYWKKDIHIVLLKYFDDMFKVFKNTYDILKKDSRFILVVGDSLFKNVYVPADLLLGIMGEKVGFEFESIQIARDRYSGQNRSYKLRETIITLKK